jgi:fumarate hydratase class II
VLAAGVALLGPQGNRYAARMTTRRERDSLGDIDVPADRYWGAVTQRALEHFPIGNERMPHEIIRALGVVKLACVLAHRDAGRIDSTKADAIATAAREVIDGKLDAHFPLVIWQTGSGTQSNMNANEVIANRANEILGAPLGSKSPVHPNDDVNKAQSSNDVFPTAMHVAIGTAFLKLLAACDALVASLTAKTIAFADVVKLGRTHLQDAVPLTLGHEIAAWGAQIASAQLRVLDCAKPLRELALGGTAVGTGLNAPDGFANAAVAHIGDGFVVAENRFALMAAHDDVVAYHGALKTLAVALTKIANDVRWLSSSTFGEISIPVGEPGSSIMPGKVNPTQAEALLMVCARVIGNDVTMGIAGSSGNFELNVMKPLLAFTAIESTNLLADAMDSFAKRCIDGIEARPAQIRAHLDKSLMLVTALAPKLGYDKAAAIAKKAEHDNTSIKEAAIALGALDVVDEATLDRLLDPSSMIPRP